MKKIVSAVTAAGLLAGAAFADVSVSYTGKNYLGANGSNVSYLGNERTDCLSLAISSAVAGAVVDVDFGSAKATKLLDEYYGWMTFSGISTTITAGAWNSRYVDRVVTDKRGVDFDAQDFELFKPGVIDVKDYRTDAPATLGNHNVAYDSDNLTKGNLAMVAAYTNTSLPGTLMVKAGLVDVTGKFAGYETRPALSKTGYWSSSNSTTGDDWTKATATDEFNRVRVYSGFVGEVAYRQDNLFAVNLAVRSYQDHTASAAVFFSPLMIENLQATAGLTFGFNGAGYVKTPIARATYGSIGGDDVIHKNDGTIGVEWAADLRLRYAFSDRFSLTTMHNFSSYLTALQVEEIHSGKAGTAGYEDETKWSTNDFAMWNMLNLTYDFAETLTAGFTVQHLATDLDQSYTDHNHLWFSPSLTIKPTENASFTVITRMHWQNFGADDGFGECNHGAPCNDPACGANQNANACKFDLKIPVIFTFKY